MREDTNSSYAARLQMASAMLWRHEVSRHQFIAVLTVLEALGFLDEPTAAHLHDDADEIYQGPPVAQEVPAITL